MKTCASCRKSKRDGSFRSDERYSDQRSPICEMCRTDKALSDAEALTQLLENVDDRDRLQLLTRVFEALPTIDIPAVPILAAGGPYFGTGSPPEGDFFSKADLETIAEQTNTLMAANELRPPSKLGHSEEQRLLNNSGLPVGDELPAAGWLTNFRVEEIGGIWKLLADVKSVPAKLGQILASGGYRTRSVELSRVTSQTSGTTYDGVVTGLAWLGAKAPAVRTLDDIWNLYADTTASTQLAVGDVVWEEEDGIMDLLSALTAAINAELAPDEPSWMWELWVNDVNLKLNTCTASDWDSDTTWIIGFKVGADNEPIVDAREKWVPSTMKLVEIDAADADVLGARSGGMIDDDEYDGYGAATYLKHRAIAHAKFRQRAADTTVMRMNDQQVQTYAKAFGIEGEGATLRTAVEAHFATTFAEEKPAADPVVPAPAPAAPAPAATEPLALTSFSEEQRRELAPVLTVLTERAERGDRAFAQHFAEVRDGKIGKAIESGRLNPADREQWVAFYNANPDLCSKQLEALPVNPVLILTFGTDDDGLTAEQRAKVDTSVEDAYLIATGAQLEGQAA